MKRSSVFITVLLSLFMFQSLWNVAAAFCDHESTKLPSQRIISQHFGHHNAPDCTQDQQQHPQLLDIYGIDKPISDQSVSKQLPAHQDVRSNDFLNHINDDHRDHLPSFAHFIVVDNQQHTAQPKFVGYPESIFIGWNNLYQSPDLYLPNPPPLSSRYKVG